MQLGNGVNNGGLCINSGYFIGMGIKNPSTRLHIEHASTTASCSSCGLYVYDPNTEAGNSYKLPADRNVRSGGNSYKLPGLE
jgi:hypothetical protein